jgi:hypothetical protein
MSTSINRQSMIAQAIKNGLDANVANYLGDSQLRQWVCNKGGVIQSKAAVVANAESHIKKDNIIAQQQVTIAALSNQPQANNQQLIDKQNEIKRLNGVNAEQGKQITLLKRQVAQLEGKAVAADDKTRKFITLYNKEHAKVTVHEATIAEQEDIIASLKESNDKLKESNDKLAAYYMRHSK